MSGKLPIALFFGVTLGCVETFDVSYVLYDDAWVVTGRITDTAPATVEIMRTAPTPMSSKDEIARVAGARVVLVDDQGDREQLLESRVGYYTGQKPGEVNKSYYLEITLPEGTELRSSPQLLKVSPSLDSVYIENVEGFQSTAGTVKIDNRGLNLNLYMNRTDTLSHYYKWTVGGTYLTYTAFDAPGRECQSLLSDFDLQPCYITKPESSSFLLGQSPKPDADMFSLTLNYLRPSSEFAHGHSVLVTQYGLTKEAYDYWKKIEDQTISVGSVFDPPPSRIDGNIQPITNSEILVLGFFEASSVNTQRIFIEKDDFETLEDDSPAFADAGINAPCFDQWTGDFRPYDYCCDCALHANSTRVKPTFWK